ncbi:MAG: hemolysin III family protein [Fibrobacter sp.]|nr:hemolysin III family protein [Fibrobacter sp.]
MKKSEIVNMFSHLAGALGMAATTVFLINTARSHQKCLLVVIIYGLCSILLFSASALYHFKKKADNEKSIWRILDHISIYIMIAGTYTPVCFLSLKSTWWITILSIQWSLAVLGLVFELFRIRAPRWLTTSIYLLMGWVAIVAIVPIFKGIPPISFAFFVTGGVFYSSGAIIYALKKPNPFPGFLGFHEIFHFLVLIATGFFVAMIYNILVGVV